MTELARVTTLEGLAVVLKAARAHRGMSQLVLDERAGLASGHVAKIECGLKGLGKTTVPLLLGALDVELVVQLTPPKLRDEAAQKLREDFRHWGRIGAQKRARMLSPKQRRKIARAAGKASARARKQRGEA